MVILLLFLFYSEAFYNNAYLFYENAAIQYMRNNSMKNENNEINFVKIFSKVDYVQQYTNDTVYVFITKDFYEITKIYLFPISYDNERALLKIHKLWRAIIYHVIKYKYAFIGISSKKKCCNIRTVDFELYFSFKKPIIQPYICNN